jgi:hypothetical protein
VKKLLLLAAMLAVVAIVAVPALAQNNQPAAGVESATSTEPADDVDSGGCSEEDNIILRAPEPDLPLDSTRPAFVSEGTFVIPALEPGCSYTTVPGPTDGGSADRAHEEPAAQ